MAIFKQSSKKWLLVGKNPQCNFLLFAVSIYKPCIIVIQNWYDVCFNLIKSPSLDSWQRQVSLSQSVIFVELKKLPLVEQISPEMAHVQVT